MRKGTKASSLTCAFATGISPKPFQFFDLCPYPEASSFARTLALQADLEKIPSTAFTTIPP
jgi:hypothetical protein